MFVRAGRINDNCLSKLSQGLKGLNNDGLNSAKYTRLDTLESDTINYWEISTKADLPWGCRRLKKQREVRFVYECRHRERIR